jgi:hypothetical protein
MNVLSWLDFSERPWTWRHYVFVSALALAVGGRSSFGQCAGARRWHVHVGGFERCPILIGITAAAASRIDLDQRAAARR